MIKLENEKIELEKNMEMEAEMVNIRDLLKKEVDLLEKAQSITEVEKCSLAVKLERSERRCEELVLRVKKMESDKAAQLCKSRLHDGDAMSPEGRVISDDSGESGANYFMSKKGGKDMAYSGTEEDTEFTYPGSKPTYVSAVAESKGSDLDNEGREPEVRGASYSTSARGHCNLKVISIIKKNLHKENLETFEQMCFGNMLKMNEFKFQGPLIKQLLLQMDMKASNKRKLVFKINNSTMEFGPREFFNITGLRLGKLEACTTTSSIYRDVFKCRPNISLKDIEEAFINISRRDNGKGELTLKLSLLYFLYGTLLVRLSYQKIDLQYLHYVEDLQKFNAFPWGQVAYELLVSSILLVRANMDSSKSSFNIYGFCYALQAWAYEVMPFVASYCAYHACDFETITPWILRWSATKFIKYDDLNNIFPLGDNAHLKTTTVEREELLTELETPLSKAKQKKRKFRCDDDEMLHSQPSTAATPTTPPPTSAYPLHHVARALSAEASSEQQNVKVEPLTSTDAHTSIPRKERRSQTEDDQPIPNTRNEAAAAEVEDEEAMKEATPARHRRLSPNPISTNKSQSSLPETKRNRALMALAFDDNPALDTLQPWKTCDKFEISRAEYERSKEFYEMLLERSKRLRLWISYAQFEAFAMIQGSKIRDKRKRLEHGRAVFERGLSYFRSCAPKMKEKRAMLLEEWFDMEYRFGEVGDVSSVRAMLPQKLKKRRRLRTEDGSARYEEYIDYLFPKEEYVEV